jgi:hypothetical protein
MFSTLKMKLVYLSLAAFSLVAAQDKPNTDAAGQPVVPVRPTDKPKTDPAGEPVVPVKPTDKPKTDPAGEPVVPVKPDEDVLEEADIADWKMVARRWCIQKRMCRKEDNDWNCDKCYLHIHKVWDCSCLREGSYRDKWECLNQCAADNTRPTRPPPPTTTTHEDTRPPPSTKPHTVRPTKPHTRPTRPTRPVRPDFDKDAAYDFCKRRCMADDTVKDKRGCVKECLDRMHSVCYKFHQCEEIPSPCYEKCMAQESDIRKTRTEQTGNWKDRKNRQQGIEKPDNVFGDVGLVQPAVPAPKYTVKDMIYKHCNKICQGAKDCVMTCVQKALDCNCHEVTDPKHVPKCIDKCRLAEEEDKPEDVDIDNHFDILQAIQMKAKEWCKQTKSCDGESKKYWLCYSKFQNKLYRECERGDKDCYMKAFYGLQKCLNMDDEQIKPIEADVQQLKPAVVQSLRPGRN